MQKSLIKSEKKTRKQSLNIAVGAVSGILNGLFGSGGGIAAVSLLEISGIEPKKSHATSVALILFLSIVSSAGYASFGYVPWETVLPMIPAGLIGSVLGSYILKRCDNSLLRRIFGLLIIYSGGRMLFL